MNISHNTRNASKLHESYKRTNYINYVKHCSLSYKGVDAWNSLETKLNEINSYNIFKKQIKQHFCYTQLTITIRHAIKHIENNTDGSAEIPDLFRVLNMIYNTYVYNI